MATVTISERSRASGKSYIIQYNDPETGKKRYHKTCRRKAEAKAESIALRTYLDTGEWPDGREGLKSRSAMTFGEAAKLCHEWWKSKCDKGRLSKSSYASYMEYHKRPLNEWRDRLIASFSREEIERWHVKLCRDISPATANRALFTVKQTFAVACREKVLKSDPAKGISYSNESCHERKRFMKPHEVENLVKVANTRSRAQSLEVAVTLAVEHGASKQEILDLRWDDIDFEDSPSGSIRFFRTKNRMERVQDIMPRTREALLKRWEYLKEYRRKHNLRGEPEYVICRPDGTPLKGFRTSWKNLCKKLHLSDFHFHDNRHNYCTNVLHAGGTLKDVKEMIGHKTLRMTERYTGHDRDRERSIQQRLQERYAQDTRPRRPSIKKAS